MKSIGYVLSLIILSVSSFGAFQAGPLEVKYDHPLTWVSPAGTPVPFDTEEEALEFLRTARVVSWKQISEGLNKTRKVLLEKDGIQMHAAFRDISREGQIPDPRHPSFMQNHRDDAIFEVAAFRLSRMLGLKLVPPTVIREIEGHRGTLQAWVEHATMERDRRQNGIEPPDEWLWTAQMLTMNLFDNLVANIDRHQGNLLIDPDWNIWLIDHTQSFRRFKYLHAPDKVPYVDREVWEKLQELDKKNIESSFSDVLRPPEIKALSKRRDELVKQIKKLIQQRGEENVLFSADL
ncbi:MAG TPA: hypothetical protein VLV83_04380 [Acidobacteriota bacterium]|nr:hypothetical protein [Acidobacteriota bacterium]